MIKNLRLLAELENKLIRMSPANHAENLRIAEALYHEARSLGVFPLKDPLDGIDEDVALARVLNCVRISPETAGC